LQHARKADNRIQMPNSQKPTPQNLTPPSTSRNPVREFRAATAFLTRLPLSGDDTAISRTCWAFPLVGAGVGALGGAVFFIGLWLPVPPLVAALVAVAAMIGLTGALHEDGLADTVDGFGGGRDADRKLEIMRDSRIGAFGVLALILGVGLRAGSVATLAEIALPAWIAAAAISRAALPVLMAALPLASASGLAAMAGRPSKLDVFIGSVLAIIIAIFALGVGPGVAVCVTVAAAAFGVATLAQRQIHGYNGDVLGAAQQIGEIAVLLCIVALNGRGVL
jgi:adenosylcobinamide-GDP ribazoletransferase